MIHSCHHRTKDDRMSIRKKTEAGLESDMLLSQSARVLTKVEPFLNQESFSFLEPALTQQSNMPKAFQTGHTLKFFPVVLIVIEPKNNLRNLTVEIFFFWQLNLFNGVFPQVKLCARIKSSHLVFIVYLSICLYPHTNIYNICITKFQSCFSIYAS